MSNITIKMFPAKNGDCFLVSLGTIPKKHILIDCGYVETYKKFLRKELKQIADKGECIDLMVITHIDQDHILGAISFLEENNKTNFIKINEIWHNSYKHLQFDNEKVDKISQKERNFLKNEIVLGNSHLHLNKSKSIINNEEISARQGSMLASLILEGKYAWNESFGGCAINCDTKGKLIKTTYSIELLSPNTKKLKNLSKKWITDLKKIYPHFKLSDEQLFDDAFEFYMLRFKERKILQNPISLRKTNINEDIIEKIVYQSSEEVDNSIINGSSISFIIEYDNKKMLFLADAHPDIIYEKLSKIKNIGFDLVKVSHHGSNRNTTKDLANILNANIFLISTNGDKHKHPDIEVLAKILFCQKHRRKKIVFNYESTVSKALKNDTLEKNFNYEVYAPQVERVTIINL